MALRTWRSSTSAGRARAPCQRPASPSSATSATTSKRSDPSSTRWRRTPTASASPCSSTGRRSPTSRPSGRRCTASSASSCPPCASCWRCSSPATESRSCAACRWRPAPSPTWMRSSRRRAGRSGSCPAATPTSAWRGPRAISPRQSRADSPSRGARVTWASSPGGLGGRRKGKLLRLDKAEVVADARLRAPDGAHRQLQREVGAKRRGDELERLDLGRDLQHLSRLVNVEDVDRKAHEEGVQRGAAEEEQPLAVLEALASQEALDAVNGRRGHLYCLAKDGIAVLVADEHSPALPRQNQRPVDGDTGGAQDDDEQTPENKKHEREHHLDRSLVRLLLRPLAPPHAHLVGLDAEHGRDARAHRLGLDDGIDEGRQVGHADAA